MEYGYLDKEVKALVAERDRLAAENAELRWKAKESEPAMLEAQQNEDHWKSQGEDANATLDALRAELARVKAESLRVVADECKNMDIASDWYMTLDGLGWLGYDRHNCECVETPHGYHKFDDCRKVKLERWEATIHPLQSLADNQVPPVPEFDAIAAEHFDELIGGVDT